jgi:adenylate kinase
LFGPPGSGKDPQATRLAERLGLVHISSGDLLRGEIEAGTSLGEQAKPCIEAGDLVPDEWVVRLVVGRLREPDVRNRGFVLEGFPRTIPQAEALDAELARQGTFLEWGIQLEADEGPVLERTAGRGGRGDRPDDKEEVVRYRIRVHRDWTRPLAEYYRSIGRLIALDASQPLDDVSVGMYRELRERGVDVGEPEVTEEERERESDDY